MATAFAIALTVAVLCLMGIVRNHIVFAVRCRRLHEIKTACDLQLANHGIFAMADKWYEEFERVSYDAMVFDLRRWTYKQFYPNPVE